MTEHSASNASGATAASAGTSGSTGSDGGGKRTAGIFDIRVIIGALLGLFGLILVLTSLFSNPQAQVPRANDVDLNLWTGLSLLAAAAIFILWARLRPIVVDESAASGDRPAGH
jgi:hypothetical protein